MMKLEPLNQFICDRCGELIKNVEDGWLEWLDDGKTPIHGFKIVHISGASPRAKEDGYCYYPESGAVSNNPLSHFTDTNGLTYLISFLDRKLADPRELAEIIRRLHIPHYEEARQYLERALKEGFIDPNDFTQHNLERIIKKYRD
jgi:hypothetical protein